MQEYLTHGLYQSTAYYVISFCALIFMNKISRRNHSFVSHSFGARIPSLTRIL